MPPRIQIFQASTLYGAATLAAALDAGQFGPRADSRRILLVCNNAPVPETAAGLDAMLGYDRIAARFDSVISWNETIRPYHPGAWGPRAEDVVLWQRALRLAWGLGEEPVELVLESIQVDPARALAAIFSESTLHVYADGLMSYGPTRTRLPQSIGCRVQRVLHLDLVPGLRPLLLSEFDVAPELVPADAFRKVLGEIADSADGDPALTEAVAQAPTAVLLGQYLAALDILTVDEEEDLHIRMLRGAARAGHTSVLFKPHPTAPARYSDALDRAAAETGVRLVTTDTPLLAETLFERCAPSLVVGCFSTAMLTAAVHYGIPVARVGTGLVLERVAPYENSNRVPLTIVDHLVPDLEGHGGGDVSPLPDSAPATLGPLVRTVGYCMQSGLHPELRGEAENWLRERLDGSTRHYFKRRRLGKLSLPGGSAQGAAARLRRTVRRTRNTLRV
ncbi:polysialyltransferase family glycosyltransferase [Streptomyces sp. NPDC052042]|uniref:polysialyltransferase family glycosyltransferase n=1 Tax=Streptomyces sp. NPDC052042 TaxID=3365683 RepID=UPI0037CCDE85